MSTAEFKIPERSSAISHGEEAFLKGYADLTGESSFPSETSIRDSARAEIDDFFGTSDSEPVYEETPPSPEILQYAEKLPIGEVGRMLARVRSSEIDGNLNGSPFDLAA